MKAVVTGGAGFIGSHVVERLLREGYKVHIADNQTRARLLHARRRSDHNPNYLRREEGVSFSKLDIRNASSLRRVCEDANLIVHAAAQTAVTSSLTDPRTDFEINAAGTFNLLEALRRFADDSVFLFLSTNKVYGSNVNGLPTVEKERRYDYKDGLSGISETLPIDNCEHSPYGCSKLAGDIYTQDYGKTYGLKTGVFRMSCIYGPRQMGVEDQGWVAWFTIASLNRLPITIFGNGKQVRDILFVDDLTSAVMSFNERAASLKGEVFNMGGGPANTVSLLELLALLEELGAPKAKLKFDHWRPSDQLVYVSDIGKARKELGFEPRTSARDGVTKLFTWVRDNLQLYR